jgi:hypothetical protein
VNWGARGATAKLGECTARRRFWESARESGDQVRERWVVAEVDGGGLLGFLMYNCWAFLFFCATSLFTCWA